MGGAQDGDALNCGSLTLAWINATTKVMIGTCASGATEPDLCVAQVKKGYIRH